MLLRGVAQSGRRGLAARPVRVSARGLAAAAAAGQRILYRSTRGGQSDLTFSEAVLQGLGTDKGLLVPQAIPRFDAATLESWRGLPFHALAAEVMSLYLTDDDLSRSELEASQQPLPCLLTLTAAATSMAGLARLHRHRPHRHCHHRHCPHRHRPRCHRPRCRRYPCRRDPHRRRKHPRRSPRRATGRSGATRR